MSWVCWRVIVKVVSPKITATVTTETPLLSPQAAEPAATSVLQLGCIWSRLLMLDHKGAAVDFLQEAFGV
jgi:hypothetical protein